MRQVATYKGKTAQIIKILNDEADGTYYQIVVDKKQFSAYPSELENIHMEGTNSTISEVDVSKSPPVLTSEPSDVAKTIESVEALIWINDPEIKAYQIASAIPGLGRVTAEKIINKRDSEFDGEYPDVESIPLTNEKHRAYFSVEKIESNA